MVPSGCSENSSRCEPCSTIRTTTGAKRAAESADPMTHPKTARTVEVDPEAAAPAAGGSSAEMRAIVTRVAAMKSPEKVFVGSRPTEDQALRRDEQKGFSKKISLPLQTHAGIKLDIFDEETRNETSRSVISLTCLLVGGLATKLCHDSTRVSLLF